MTTAITSLRTESGWQLLRETTRGHRRDLLALLGWSVVEAAPALLSGVLIAKALDHGFLAGNWTSGALYLVAYAAVVVVSGLGARQSVMPLARIVESMRFDLVVRTVTATLTRGAHGEHVDGRAVEGVTKHTEVVRMLFSQLLTVMRTSVFSLVFVTAGLFSLVPLIAWTSVASTLLVTGVLVVTARGWQRRIRASLLAEERLSGNAGAAVLGLRDVVACAASERATKDLTADVETHAAAAYEVAKAVTARVGVLSLGGKLPLAILLVTAPSAVASGTLTAGELVGAVTYLVGNLDPVLRAIVRVAGDIGLQIGVLLARIAEYARMPEAENAKLPSGGSGGALQLRAVSFGYSATSERVLDGIDLAVAPGERLAVVGPSGAGKSTLANVIAGLDLAQDGEVERGGRVTLLPQEAYVFSGTVRENLTYLNLDASDAEVAAACRAVGSDELVAARGGLDGMVSSPNELSEGQKQLVALTRAYLSTTEIVVLDEATCHLHPERERRAEEAFAATGRTLVLIAHRMSSAMRADRVALLHEGGLDVGTHDELKQTCPLYADLVGYWNEA